VSCAGCDAPAAQIVFLQALVAKLEARLERQEERLLALANPAALAQARGEPATPEPQRVTDESGTEWVIAQGRKIKADEFEAMLRGEGAIGDTGQFIPNAEMDRAADMLNKMLSGTPAE